MVRTTQKVFPSVFLTISQAREVDRYKSNTPTSYGCGPEDLARVKRRLAVETGRDPRSDEIVVAVNDEIPATESQLAYALGVGLKLPPNPTKNHVSYLLHCYESLKWDIAAAWREQRGRDAEPPEHEIGFAVSTLLADDEYAAIIRSSRYRDFHFACGIARAQKRMTKVLENLWH